MNPLAIIKNEVAIILSRLASGTIAADDLQIPESTLGDLTLPCFKLAKEAHTAPNVLAKDLADQLNAGALQKYIERAEATGPYLNIFYHRVNVATLLQTAITVQYGETKNKGSKILLEYISPNTNKPFHLGHLRNATYGAAVAKLLQATGHQVITTQIVNDRGIAIMQAVLGYAKWGNNETPTNATNGDELVAKYYVMFNKEAQANEELKAEAQIWLQRWEAGDPEVRDLWAKLNSWTLTSHNFTEQRLGVTTDKKYYESDIYQEGREIVEDALQNNVVSKNEDGAAIIEFSKEEVLAGEDVTKILLRADGTTVYITQDLALMKRRLKDFAPNKLIWITAKEQDLQFRILIATIKKIHLADDVTLQHLSYGYVNLPEGRMKSREGTVVDVNPLLNNMEELAKNEITMRDDSLDDEEVARRAHLITLAAAKFYMLRVGAKSDIKFDPLESISFTGKTGPYLLYTIARLNSIFSKAQGVPVLVTTPTEITDAEWQLLMHIARFPEEVKRAAELYDPSVVAEYAYTLAQKLSEFYEHSPVLQADADVRAWRLNLLKWCHTTLTNALSLLGIETLERM